MDWIIGLDGEESIGLVWFEVDGESYWIGLLDWIGLTRWDRWGGGV